MLPKMPHSISRSTGTTSCHVSASPASPTTCVDTPVGGATLSGSSQTWIQFHEHDLWPPLVWLPSGYGQDVPAITGAKAQDSPNGGRSGNKLIQSLLNDSQPSRKR
jgi:hypothetical protein